MACPQREPITVRPEAELPDPNRRLRRFVAREVRRLHGDVRASAAACDADRYRKHFDAVAHFGLLVFHGLQPRASLRGSYAAIFQCPALAAASGLVGPDGSVVARGLVNYDSDELPALLGRTTRDLAAELGAGYDRTVVHRDALVVMENVDSKA